MGYTTDFSGEFTLDKPLTVEQVAYLQAFNHTRKMKRRASLITIADPLREAVGLPLGDEGGYFVGLTEDFGQHRTGDVLDYNSPPKGQPGLWCQWVPSDDGTVIRWDEGEKFYDYVEWIEYIIEHFLKRWGHVLNGTVEWQGEDSDDRGRIVIMGNVVKTQLCKFVYEE